MWYLRESAIRVLVGNTTPLQVICSLCRNSSNNIQSWPLKRRAIQTDMTHIMRGTPGEHKPNLEFRKVPPIHRLHYNGVIMTTIASQITSLTSVYSIVYSDADRKKHQSSTSLPLCGEITGTGEFPAQRASYAENVSIWWRHHVMDQLWIICCQMSAEHLPSFNGNPLYALNKSSIYLIKYSYFCLNTWT